MATRFSAAAAAIGLAGGVVAAVPAGAAAYGTGPGTIVTVTDAASTTASGTLIGFPAFARGPIRFDPEAGTGGFPLPGTAAPARAAAPAPAADPVRNTAPALPAARQPVKRHDPAQPFHKTGRKARRLPDTGVPLSAALGAVTALTALPAGIGTVLAARRRPDHEGRC